MPKQYYTLDIITDGSDHTSFCSFLTCRNCKDNSILARYEIGTSELKGRCCADSKQSTHYTKAVFLLNVSPSSTSGIPSLLYSMRTAHQLGNGGEDTLTMVGPQGTSDIAEFASEMILGHCHDQQCSSSGKPVIRRTTFFPNIRSCDVPDHKSDSWWKVYEDSYILVYAKSMNDESGDIEHDIMDTKAFKNIIYLITCKSHQISDKDARTIAIAPIGARIEPLPDSLLNTRCCSPLEFVLHIPQNSNFEDIFNSKVKLTESNFVVTPNHEGILVKAKKWALGLHTLMPCVFPISNHMELKNEELHPVGQNLWKDEDKVCFPRDYRRNFPFSNTCESNECDQKHSPSKSNDFPTATKSDTQHMSHFRKLSSGESIVFFVQKKEESGTNLASSIVSSNNLMPPGKTDEQSMSSYYLSKRLQNINSILQPQNNEENRLELSLLSRIQKLHFLYSKSELCSSDILNITSGTTHDDSEINIDSDDGHESQNNDEIDIDDLHDDDDSDYHLNDVSKDSTQSLLPTPSLAPVPHLLVLGTGSSAPATLRGSSGYALLLPSTKEKMKSFSCEKNGFNTAPLYDHVLSAIIDCGEGTLAALSRTLTNLDGHLQQIKFIWISHSHFDHYGGLPTLIWAIFKAGGRKHSLDSDSSSCETNSPVIVICPNKVLKYLDQTLQCKNGVMTIKKSDDDNEKRRRSGKKQKVTSHNPINSDGTMRSQSQKRITLFLGVNHAEFTRSPFAQSLRDIVFGCKLPLYLSPSVIKYYNPFSLIRSTLVDHCPYANGLILGVTCPSLNIDDEDTTFFLCYSGDTRPSRNLVQACNNTFHHSTKIKIDLLIHESTFDNDSKGQQEAVKKRHSTIGEAIMIYKQIGAKFCILSHFSHRYPNGIRINKTHEYIDLKSSLQANKSDVARITNHSHYIRDGGVQYNENDDIIAAVDGFLVPLDNSILKSSLSIIRETLERVLMVEP